MRASNFLSTQNWTWLSVVVVSLFLNDSVTCSDGKEDYVSSHFDSLNCMMAEGGNNEDKQECNPMQAINRPMSDQVPPMSDALVRPGDGWPGAAGEHIRSPLARTIYQKMREDELNKNDKHVYWYRVITSRFPENLQQLFLQLDQDESTDEFLHNCQEKSDQIFTQIFYSLARPVLSFIMTQTSINGFLNRGSMFIFSERQFEKLLGISSYHKFDNLLDLGAGDGMVTLRMSSYFNNTYATEMSTPMVRRLTGHGFKILNVDSWHKSNLQFDLIACLNLLDRCDKPLTVLADIRRSLKPGTGRALVAVVIPFKPFVEFESKTNQPTEYLRVQGKNFEEEVEKFISVFHQQGFQVEKFTRLPYLCEGDLKHSFYVLTDAVFVLKLAESPSTFHPEEPPS